MQIINSNIQHCPNFGVNLNSPKLRFNRKDFFVKIAGYGKNEQWADEVIKTADTAVLLIRKNTSAENILKYIASGITKANQKCHDYYKKIHSGMLRTFRDGWACEDISTCILTDYSQGRYSKYKFRLDALVKKPLKSPKEDIGITRPNQYQSIIHGDPSNINNSLDYVFSLCKNIFPKYVQEEVKPENLDEINSIVAEIRWVLAHSTPWHRGSDAISNVLIRSIYKAIGVKSYPLKKGISLDLEAFCTELNEYKRKFTGYFTKSTEIVE